MVIHTDRFAKDQAHHLVNLFLVGLLRFGDEHELFGEVQLHATAARALELWRDIGLQRSTRVHVIRFSHDGNLVVAFELSDSWGIGISVGGLRRPEAV